MSSTAFVFCARASNTRFRKLNRAAVATFACGILLAGPRAGGAQTSPAPSHSWELLVSSGALIPTGAQRDVLKDAQMSTAQVSYVIRSRFAITTSLGWARSRDLATVDDPKLDVFTFDVGGEARAPQWRKGFTPFVGVGAGSRSYSYRSLDRDATHNIAGYGAVGGEAGGGRVRVRLEVRNYVSGFKPLVSGGSSGTRTDFVGMLGLRLARK